MDDNIKYQIGDVIIEKETGKKFEIMNFTILTIQARYATRNSEFIFNFFPEQIELYHRAYSAIPNFKAYFLEQI